jgi:cell division protein ZipA
MDDILHVRKITRAEESNEEEQYLEESETPSLGINLESKPTSTEPEIPKKTIMFFLAAQGQNIFAGYELLQTLLSCGLRFGDGGLFHRHQHASGQGPVLFSLAAATQTGVFDLQNMGAMSMKGLCMFMELSMNSTIDQERFELFVQTAKQLSTELHALLLDEKQKPITSERIAKLERMIAQEVGCVSI